jgi:hypothetical protein
MEKSRAKERGNGEKEKEGKAVKEILRKFIYFP